jgi:hypothetical protein
MYVALPPLGPVKAGLHGQWVTAKLASGDEELAGHAEHSASQTALVAEDHVPAVHAVQAPDTTATLNVPATQFSQTIEASAAE